MIHERFQERGHQFICDFRMLTSLLSHNGFGDIERPAYRESAGRRLLNDTERRASESLYVDARKPAVA